MSFRNAMSLPALVLLAPALSAQAPIQVFSVTGNPSTPSTDPHDPTPERSMYVAFDADRPVSASEVTIIRESEGSNLTTVGARFFQRATPRGTWLILVEVRTRPTVLGNPASGGFEVYLGWELAAPIQTAPSVAPTKNNTPQTFYIQPGPSGTFDVIAPKKGLYWVMTQNADLMNSMAWGSQQEALTPTGSKSWTGPNDSYHYDAGFLPGLINVYSELVGSGTWAQVTLLNMAVEPEEWVGLPILAGPYPGH